MEMRGDHPVVFINSTVGILEYYQVDLRTIFTNNASFYCPRTLYDVVTVYNYSSGYVFTQEQWKDRFHMVPLQGILEFVNVRSQFMYV